MNWVYNGEPYTEKHDDNLYGFIYCIHFEAGNGELYSYYGKKNFNSVTKKNFGKRKLSTITDKRLKKYEMITEESNWKLYVGSCKDTKDYIPIHKEILQFARTSRELTWLELKTMILYGAIEDPKSLNSNLLGRFFRDNLV